MHMDQDGNTMQQQGHRLKWMVYVYQPYIYINTIIIQTLKSPIYMKMEYGIYHKHPLTIYYKV